MAAAAARMREALRDLTAFHASRSVMTALVARHKKISAAIESLEGN